MFLAVPGRSPAWASPPSGEAGPGKAVLVATGFLWAGADRGRLLSCGAFACAATSWVVVCAALQRLRALRRCPQREADQLTGGLLASRRGETRHSSCCLRGISAEESSEVSNRASACEALETKGMHHRNAAVVCMDSYVSMQ